MMDRPEQEVGRDVLMPSLNPKRNTGEILSPKIPNKLFSLPGEQLF